MPELLELADVSFDIQTDCVVVGAGACGLTAALALNAAGVDTLVLERDARPTGSTCMSSGFIPAAGTRQQQQQGIDDSAALFAGDIQRKAKNQADPAIVAAVTEHSGATLDWLADTCNLQWVLLDDFLYPGHSAHRMHAAPEKTGAALHTHLLNASTTRGVDIATDATVDALIIDRPVARLANRDGGANQSVNVCGVRLKRPDGSHETVRAAAVILACNGYGGNAELMQRFIPEMTDALYHGHAGNNGDAVLWGEQLGLPLQHTGAYQGHGSVAVGHNILITWALMMEGGVQVNKHAQRFSNEHGGYSEQAVHVLAQTDGIAWDIYDHRLHTMGLNFPDYCDADKAGAVIQGEDAAELASLTGLPLADLSATLKQISELAKHNSTDTFGRHFNAAQVLQPPYHAIKVGAAVFHTQGGLVVDAQAQVLGKDGLPVGNLYAAGGAAVGVSGATVEGYLSGNGLLTAVVQGKIAAYSIVASQTGQRVTNR